MIRFCTYFDANFLVRGVTLCRSILRYLPDCEIWVLCLDDATVSAVRSAQLPGVRAVPRASLESFDPQLAAAAGTRSLIEYYFTCTPAWCRYVLALSAPEDVVCYVDADVLFYGNPNGAVDELGAGAILIVPHRFPPGSSAADRAGVFNVGLIVFRNNDTTRRCLTRWREQCLAWCRDVAAEGRFADQKYLDDWPVVFPDVVVSRRLGSCLAPWNLAQYQIDTSAQPIMVNGEPLVFFHFHGLTIFSAWLYDSGTKEYGSPQPAAERFLYSHYMAELRATASFLRARGIKVTMHDWILRRRRRSFPAILRKLGRARLG